MAKKKKTAPAKRTPAKRKSKIDSTGQAPGVAPFTIKYKLIDENPIERTSPNPSGYKYVRASWKDRESGDIKTSLVLLTDKQIAEAKKNK